MSDYTLYVAAVYGLAILVYGGYTLRWRASYKKLEQQRASLSQESP
ncbi:MAG: hypothetical protein HQL97_04990 [Magnetococcales bacterium]|nr:hypothetical protein [Magnetococcales bacterium]